MKLDFYYWGYQCPISFEINKLLEEYKNRFDIHTYNIEEDFGLAKKQKMFFPFLTVIDNKERYRSPINKVFLNKLLNGEKIIENPYIIDFGIDIYKGNILPLTKDNISLISKKCTMTNCCYSCHEKSIFLSKYCDEVFGYLNVEDGNVLGGVEYVPTRFVPYDIPRSDNYVFLTCLYHSSKEYDYKHYPLLELEKYLKNNYNRIYAITDEVGTFPNGNLQWFLDHDYIDNGVISEEKNYCKLHLVSKNI